MSKNVKNMKKVREKKNKKIIKNLKNISFICMMILFFELLYVGYSLLYKNKESIYFDGINAIVSKDSYYATVGSNNNNDNFYEKAKISKYNERKEKTFEKLYNVGFNSVFFGVAVDDKDLVAVGSYEKTLQDHENSVRRALIVKYDEFGKVLFEKDLKMLDNSKFTNVIKVDDGYLVTGQSVYKNTKVGSSEGGALLVKYNKAGKILWKKTYGNSKSAIFNDLLIVGDYIYTVGTDDNHIGIICKYDMDGNFITYNDYKYIDDIGFSGIVNIGDRIYISGANRVTKDNTNAMIVEYDTNCTYKEQVVYERSGIERYNKLIVDDDENLVAIGTMAINRVKNSKSVDEFNYDGIIGKYSGDLKKIDVATYGDERDDYFTDIKVVGGNYLIVGYSSYEDGSYLSKFISYSKALKILGVE